MVKRISRIQLSLLLVLSTCTTVLVGQADPLISEVMASNTRSGYDPDFGAFSDWIEIYNPASVEIDLSGWYITDDPFDPEKWEFPHGSTIPAMGYILCWADDLDLVPGDKATLEFTEKVTITVRGYHLNFRLSRDQAELRLYNSKLELVDSLGWKGLERDYSIGKISGEDSEWFYFAEHTPGGPNNSTTATGFDTLSMPAFSLPAGLYTGTPQLEILASEPGSVIHYTTDGSEPTSHSPIYTEPLPLYFSKVVRARSFMPGKLPGKTATSSYIINRQTTLPVLSISTEHNNLWGFDFGLYQNNYKNREVYAHLEYFDAGGNREFQINAGLQLFGSQIFMFDQKPFSIYFRNRYGQNTLNYKIFRNNPVSVFESLVLRNGGNDNGMTMFRDGLGAVLAEGELDLDVQSYQPVLVFMNGEYWGIFNIREKLNEANLQYSHGVHPGYVDVLEDSLLVNAGDDNHFRRLLDYAANHGMDQDEHFRYVAGKIDLEEFIDYMSYKIWGGYSQWQVNNKYWRSRETGGTWRWFAFDLEHCFGGPGGENYDSNTFETALNQNDPERAWHTLLFRKLMQNKEFMDAFLQHTAIAMSSVLDKRRVLEVIDSLEATIAGEMNEHIIRWNTPRSIAAWQQYISDLETFAANRNYWMFTHAMNQFGISDTFRLDLSSSNGGSLRIGHLPVRTNPSCITLFGGIPVHLEAMPEPGYRFAGWNEIDTVRSVFFIPGKDSVMHAVFEKTDDYMLPDTIRGSVVLADTSSEWTAKGNIVILPGSKLTLGAGIKLYMAPEASILNFGSLFIAGSDEAPVVLDVNRYLSKLPGQASRWGGIVFQSKDSSAISHAVLLNGSSGLKHGPFKATISAAGGSLKLDHVRISGTRDPVYAKKCRILIDSCNLSSNGTGDVINLRACESPVIRNNILRGNYYEDTDGIDLDSVNGAVVEGNLIHGFFGYNSDGIDLGESSSAILVTGNMISSCSDKGISVGQGSYVVASGNVILDCNQGFGIKDFNSTAAIYQNTLFANNTGIAVFEKNAGKGGGNAIVENTIIAGSLEKAVFVDPLSSLSVTYSLSDTDPLQGYNNLLEDPGLAGISEMDFTPRAGSPCIDAGRPDRLDPDGTRSDIGAIAFLSPGERPAILITEINFDPHANYTGGEWLEIYNRGPETADLSGWILKGGNDGDEFVFGDHVLLEPGNFLVVASNSRDLASVAGTANLEGDLAFNLANSGEKIRVYDQHYSLAHLIRYGEGDAWPDGAAGKGASLELYDTGLDNTRPENWRSSYIAGGTPAKENSSWIPVGGLYINELMAKNDGAFPDDFGEFNDWFEIFNSNDFPVDIAGLHLREGDEKTTATMVPFFSQEETTIQPGGFSVFWADKDPEQGAIHVNFKLPAQGGSLSLGQFVEKEYQVIDRIDYGIQESDSAFGRYPDGTLSLMHVRATPGNSNIRVGIPLSDQVPGLKVYPNPADDRVFISLEEAGTGGRLVLLNTTGKVVRETGLMPGTHIELDLTGLTPGLYLLLHEEYRKGIKLVVK